MSNLTTSAGVAAGLLAFAVERGADFTMLMDRAGLVPDDLEDPDQRLPLATYMALMRAAQELCDDPALALHFGEAVDLAEISIVGLIMNASATMGDAFAQMQRFGRLTLETEGLSDGPRFVLTVRDGHLWAVDTRRDPNSFPELTEGAFARLVCGPRRFLPEPHVLEVQFTHPAPAWRAEYDRIFQCPVTFSSGWNAMRLDPRIATWPVALQPRYVFGVLVERADDLLRELEDQRTVRGRVEAELLPLLHTGEISADSVARALGFSRQTLFRKLKAEGATYKTVLDDLRHRMALRYLSGAKASVNETAYLVGFSEPAAFSRAFKRWTGKSPRDVRL
ncbi:AraC-like DNA-binding protein [Caulobacter sp. BE264]|uniref:AraC family transcriptional regulator n=1 Tax=Caulobacter sp. BE264 TaxID=2817724 RepID=UPI002863D3C2|nr:AraC family transcriptional regulator ligand-binding domain-containing protein [Caulobacter sp. BE264]MDR7231148.1 AraC-like DNA-binding protein [Caulobacter sp. BE264]